MGVASSSTRAPIRAGHFDDADQDFADAKGCGDWQFIFLPAPSAAGRPEPGRVEGSAGRGSRPLFRIAIGRLACSRSGPARTVAEGSWRSRKPPASITTTNGAPPELHRQEQRPQPHVRGRHAVAEGASAAAFARNSDPPCGVCLVSGLAQGPCGTCRHGLRDRQATIAWCALHGDPPRSGPSSSARPPNALQRS